MIYNELFDASDKFLYLFTRGIIGDLYEKALATHHPKAEILDRRINHRVITDLRKVLDTSVCLPSQATVV